MSLLGVLCFMGCFLLAVSEVDSYECSRCDGIYIKNVHSGLVLSVRSGEETWMVMEEPDGSCDQAWEYKNGSLFNKKSGLALHCSKGEGHVAALTVKVADGSPNQKWEFLSNGVIKSGNGYVLDVFDWRTKPGAEVIGYFQAHKGHNQIFTTSPVY